MLLRYRIILPAVMIACILNASAQISNIVLRNTSPRCFERLEIKYDLGLSYSNPDNPYDILSWVRITEPNGITYNIHAFLYQYYNIDTNAHTLVASGDPVWKIRYAPPVTGTYSYTVYAKKSGVTNSSAPGTFTVSAAPASIKGYVQQIAGNKHFRYSLTGESFFPVGANLWDVVFGYGSSGDYTNGFNSTESYNLYTNLHNKLDFLIESGATAIRLRADSNFVTPELNPNPPDWVITGYPNGVPGFEIGRYNPCMCFILDSIVNKCAAHNIAIQWCTWNMNGATKTNPDTGIDETIRKYYMSYMRDDSWREDLVKRRLGYQVARWGWCPTLYSWEYFNEASPEQGVTITDQRWSDVTAWLDCCDYNNPYRLITNSRDGILTEEAHMYKTQWHSVIFMGDSTIPYQWGEYGFPDTELKKVNSNDPRMGAWAAFINNRSSAFYWWIEHIQKWKGTNDYAYTGLNAFLADEDFRVPLREGFFTKIHSSTNDLDGKDCLIAGNRAYVWLVRTPPAETNDYTAYSGLQYDVFPLSNGTYTVQWWNAQSGTIISTATVTNTVGKVRLNVPDNVTRDIAAKLIRQ